jgi:hypothetical protein
MLFYVTKQGCSFGGCGRPVNAKGLCFTHYHQQRRGQDLRPITGRGGRHRVLGLCAFDGCGRSAKLRGLCEAHNRQRERGQELRPIQRRKPATSCAFESCGRLAKTLGLCEAHYAQKRRGKALTPIFVPTYRYVTEGGYILIQDPTHPNAQKTGMLLEHVKVMSDHLGRMLWPDENVHHKNGKRDDNRLDNLELWSTRQPKGQRVEDKVEFAVEMLRRYRPELLKEFG